MDNFTWLKAAKLTAIDYFQNTSLTGFKLLFFLDKSKLLQIIWMPFLLTGLVAAIYITAHCIIFFQLNPTVTYINTFQYPATEVPFPAVSICSTNKFSNESMKDYVNYVYRSRWIQQWSKDVIYKKFDYFGAFFDSNGFDIDEAYEVQAFLDKLNPLRRRFYNVSSVLARLAPKCEDILRKCSWRGKIYPCSELFTTNATPEGMCCIFNYHRMGRDMRQPPVKYLDLVGRDLGLKVLLNATKDDYFFTSRSTSGFIVQIFNSLIFPDILTGKLSEFPVSPHMDVLAPLSLKRLSSDDEIRDFTPAQRRCYFPDENIKEYGMHYSQTECLLRCKLRSIQSLCNCIPFYTPADLIDWDASVMYCTLAHLECLSRYKVTWTSYRPSKETAGLEQEMEDALTCRSCYTLCNTDEYEHQLDTTNFDMDAKRHDEFLASEVNLTDPSLLRIYYESPYALQYKKQAIYTANSLFANVGGILSISIGCSVISLIEICYFATVKFYFNLKRLRKVAAIKKEQENPNRID